MAEVEIVLLNLENPGYGDVAKLTRYSVPRPCKSLQRIRKSMAQTFFFLSESRPSFARSNILVNMVYRMISKDIRERVLWLINHRYATADICVIFGISYRSLQHWQCNQALISSAFVFLLAPRARLVG